MATLKEVYIRLAAVIAFNNSLPDAEKASYKRVVQALSEGSVTGLNAIEGHIYRQCKEEYDTAKAQFNAYYACA